jgi:hypothetical protein
VNTSFINWGEKNGYSYRDRTGFETPAANGCLVADLDGDGFVDLIVTAADHRSKIFWGSSHGIDLQAPTTLPVENSVSASRLDSDLLLATSQGIDRLTVRGRDFKVEPSIPFEGAGKVVVKDLNGDGVDDLVVTCSVTGADWKTRTWATTSRIFWGEQQGSRVSFKDSMYTDLPTLGVANVAVGDINGDGFPDIVFANLRTHLSFDVPSYVCWGGPQGYGKDRRAELPTHGAKAVSISGKDVFLAKAD